MQWKRRGAIFTEKKQETVNTAENKVKKEPHMSQLHKAFAKSEVNRHLELACCTRNSGKWFNSSAWLLGIQCCAVELCRNLHITRRPHPSISIGDAWSTSYRRMSVGKVFRNCLKTLMIMIIINFVYLPIRVYFSK